MSRWCAGSSARRAARRSVKLVHVGRPWALHECFDLIITTPQYRLPERANILQNEAPLHRVTPERLDAARKEWEGRLTHLPGPRIAVILGGNAGPYNFDRENGALLGWHANSMAAGLGGSLLVTTSARTPAKAIDALEAEIRVPAFVYRWSKDATDNPYFGFLALADRLIVTCDSMSMLAEACSTEKPVFIFDLARGPDSRRPPLPSADDIRGRSPTERLADYRLQPLIYRFGLVAAPKRLTRDVTIIHRRQVEAGRAVWLGDPWREESGLAPPLADLDRAAAAVRALFAEGRASSDRHVPTGLPVMPGLFRRLLQ